MTPTLKLTKLVMRPDGKYDCEVLVKGYWSGYEKNKFGGHFNKGYTDFTKGQKVVLTVEEDDLGEDVCALMDNIREYIDDNKEQMLKTWEAIEDGSLQVDEPTARWKGAGMGDYTCSKCNDTISGRPTICPSCKAVMSNPEEPKQWADWENDSSAPLYKSPEAQQAACDSKMCCFPECDHVCGYNPDKDDLPGGGLDGMARRNDEAGAKGTT